MDYYQDLTARIRLALAHGATAAQIARGAGVDPAYISRIQSGKQMPSQLVLASKIATWCDKHCTGHDLGNTQE